MKTTYLEKVMNGKTLKVLHWHVITWVYLIVSDDCSSPSITLIQYQVGRTFVFLWRIGLVRSFYCRREVLRLDRWNSLDGWSGLRHQVHCRGVQVYHRRRDLGNLGGGVLPNFYFLEPWGVGRSPRSTELDIPILFPAWTPGFWMTKGVTSSKTNTSSSPLITLATPFPLFSFIVATPMLERTKLVKRKW